VYHAVSTDSSVTHLSWPIYFLINCKIYTTDEDVKEHRNKIFDISMSSYNDADLEAS
jgi:hypothetical protein